jgi:DDE superfamily endonuclease
MPTSALATFAAVLSSFRGHFTAPTFVRFVILAVGWILAVDVRGGGCVTEALVAARVSGRLHWEAFHRFFSRAVWDPDALGRTLLRLLQPLLDVVIEIAVDDTVCRKRGHHVFGTSMHVDAVTSTRKRRNLVRGHCWVELVVVVRVPWSKRVWAVPLLSRLYVGKREAGATYQTKGALARTMIETVLAWLPPTTRVRLLLDSGYMTRTVLRGLPLDRVTVIGGLRTNAAFYRVPPARPRRGRPRKKGARLATPAAMHHDGRRAWTALAFGVGAAARTKDVLSFVAQWYGVLGARPVRIALVREDAAKLRVVLCTDATTPPAEVLTQGARRWPIEVWNRDVKQFFGFADSPARSARAVLRTAPWVALLSGVLVVWFHRVYTRDLRVPLPVRPWYVTKEDLSFADVVRAAQETLRPVEVVRWAGAVAAKAPWVLRGARPVPSPRAAAAPPAHRLAKAA